MVKDVFDAFVAVPIITLHFKLHNLIGFQSLLPWLPLIAPNFRS